MLSPFKFLEKVSKDSDTYKEDYFYKINIYISSAAWEIRNIGVKLIGLFQDQSKADYLTGILASKTENGFVRRNALTSLNRLETWNPEVKRLVMELLVDSYYEVRSAAVDFLTKHSSPKDYADYEKIVRIRLKKCTIEEKLAYLKLIANIGDKKEINYLGDYYLSSNSLIREELLELIYNFYRRNLLTADEVREHIQEILITSNNMTPEFAIKAIIKKIYKEIEKG